MPTASLCFDDVSVTGDEGQPILTGLSCELPLQGINVVVGPSGAGKTTLLRLCNRLEVPSAGRVLLGGDDLATVDPLALRRRVGMVFQRPVLLGGTVRDNLVVAAPRCADDELVAVLTRVGLDGAFVDRPGDELSGGEAQRVCLARTLLTRPQVLLMDEPTSALDPDQRLNVEQQTRALADQGIAVLWVTHDLDQARRLADRLLVLISGRLASAAERDAFLRTEGD